MKAFCKGLGEKREKTFNPPYVLLLLLSVRRYFQPRLTRLFLILSQGCHQFSYNFILKFTIFSTKKFVLIVLLIHKIPRFKIWCISRFWQKCKNLGCLKNCLVSITLLASALVFFSGYIHQWTGVFLRKLIFLEKVVTLSQQHFKQDG